MIGPEVETGGRDSSHSPIGLGHELFAFEAGEHLYDHLLSMNVGALNGLCLQLRCLLVLFLDPLYLLLLDIDRCDLHSEDDVLDLALSETSHIHVVLLGVVRQD